MDKKGGNQQAMFGPSAESGMAGGYPRGLSANRKLKYTGSEAATARRIKAAGDWP